MDNVHVQIEELIQANSGVIKKIVCDGYESMPLIQICAAGSGLADSIIESLSPFSDASKFPETFNARVVNGKFALAFLMSSGVYRDFITVIRLGQSPANFDSYGFSSIFQFVRYLLETFSQYVKMSEDSDSVVCVLADVANQKTILPMEDGKLVLQVDLLNSTDHILSTIERIIEDQKRIIDDFQRQVVKLFCPDIDGEVLGKRLFSNYGLASSCRKYEKKWPEWYEAYQVLRLRAKGATEQEIVMKLYGASKDSNEYPTRKKTIHNRKSLGNSLRERAYMRLPLADL